MSSQARFEKAVPGSRPVSAGSLERVLGLGGKFRYVHQLEDPDDRVAILEFATEVDGEQVEAIDKLTFDEEGLITELKVMLRPASALALVGERMAAEFPQVGLSLPRH